MFEFPKLPYELDALEPVLSERQVDIHYNKHHRKYYDNLKKLIEGTRFEDMSLVSIIKQAQNPTMFNNAAQVYNHDIWWHSLSPKPVDVPENLEQSINTLYGTFDEFKEMFIDRAAKHFGSGWAWLVRAEDEVEIWITHDADTPVKEEHVSVLLTVDLWEHAWYLDYQNDKKQYLEKVFDILNWEYANKNLIKTM